MTPETRRANEMDAMRAAMKKGIAEILDKPHVRAMKMEIIELLVTTWMHGFVCGGEYEAKRSEGK